MTFSLNPFIVRRRTCSDRVIYACTNVLGPDGTTFNELCSGFSASTGLDLTATEDNYLGTNGATQLPPGDYTFTITATAPDGVTTETADFTWTLVDPCDNLDTFTPTT